MNSRFKSVVRSIDEMISSGNVKIYKEKNSLKTFLFQGLFADLNELKAVGIDPLEKTTVESLKHLVEYLLYLGYIILSLEDILNGLETDKKYLLITFYDRCYSNNRALTL